jgi:hypothetical protein
LGCGGMMGMGGNVWKCFYGIDIISGYFSYNSICLIKGEP